MALIRPFEQYANLYENLFGSYKFAYLSELDAVGKIFPLRWKGIEIGAGSGRFSGPLGIRIGIEFSQR